MQSLTAHEQKAVHAFKTKVVSLLGHQLVAIRLFGSRARGEGHEASDIDILVLVADAPAKVRGSVYNISADIMLDYDIDISPLVMSESHYRDMKSRERMLALDIEREGIPL